VGYPHYRRRALVDVVVPGEDHVYAVASKQRFEVLSYQLIGAVPRRAIEGPVQEGEFPALACGGEVPLQEGLLLLGAGAPVVVVELAVEGDEVGSSPVERVETFGAAGVMEGRVEVIEVGTPSLWRTSWLPSTRNMGTSLIRVRYGAKKRLS
jgi:hypothetical protein